VGAAVSPCHFEEDIMANQNQQQPRQGSPGRQNQNEERREAPSKQPEQEEQIKRGQAGREADPESELEEGDRRERELEDEGDVD
jgi:hypothetical protein